MELKKDIIKTSTLWLSGCFFLVLSSLTTKNIEIMDNKFDKIFIFQNGKEVEIDRNSYELKIEKKPFSIRFYNKKYDSEKNEFYAVQVGAFLEEDVLKKMDINMLQDEVPCFEAGTGMACTQVGYESLIFNNQGNHYLTYESDDETRLTRIESEGDWFKLAFEINKMTIKNTDIDIENINIKQFYLAILIDKNLDDKIDKGELTKLKIVFK